MTFLNYSFDGSSTDTFKGDLAEREHGGIALYKHVVSGVDFEGSRVLEVSCGHGGGAAWISRELNPEQILAIDMNPEAIQFARERFSGSGVTFEVGDAENLEYPAESFDIVVNVEASHCYGDFPAFVEGCRRILRPGGRLLYADFRYSSRFEEWMDAISGSGFFLQRETDVTQKVIRGIEATARETSESLNENFPWWMRRFAREFAALPGARTYESLVRGDAKYLSMSLQKPNEQCADVPGAAVAGK